MSQQKALIKHDTYSRKYENVKKTRKFIATNLTSKTDIIWKRQGQLKIQKRIFAHFWLTSDAIWIKRIQF